MSQQNNAGMASFIANNFSLIIVVGLFFLGGFFFGSLWTENQMLKKGVSPTAGTNTGTVAAANPPADSGPSADQLAQMPPVSDSDHIRGAANAEVVLVEYSDYECPFCAQFHPVMKQVLEEYGNQVAWVYRHYPLPFHPNAQKSAEGAECVAQLGGNEAFWTYSDAVVETTAAAGQLSAVAITDAATAAGVDATAFKNCLDSGEMADVVTDSMNGGSMAGVEGTPGTLVVVNGEVMEMIPGALPFEQVKATIEQYL